MTEQVSARSDGVSEQLEQHRTEQVNIELSG